ncbi:hypothetical protein [Streptomyces sp. NPDC055287]
MSETPKIDNIGKQRLPVETYLMSPDENDRIERARSALIESCMKRFGLEFSPNTPDYKQMAGQTNNRYGPTDPKAASSRGFHPAKPPKATSDEAASRKPLSPDVRTVLGIDDEPPNAKTPSAERAYKGKRIPQGGCAGETDRKLTEGGGIIQDAEVAIDINFKNFEQSTTDARVKKAFAEWSRCMKKKGFSYATPLETINDPRWKTENASDLEIATATAEVACKKQHNTVGVWLAVEKAYEEKDIKTHARELKAVRKGIDVTFENAASVVSP